VLEVAVVKSFRDFRNGVTKRHGGAVAGTAEVLTYLTETLQRSERGKSAKSRHLASFCSDN
jgi:hypothetical protein